MGTTDKPVWRDCAGGRVSRSLVELAAEQGFAFATDDGRLCIAPAEGQCDGRCRPERDPRAAAGLAYAGPCRRRSDNPQ